MSQPASAQAVVFTRRSVLASLSALLTGSSAAQAITTITLLLTARRLGVAGYGLYAASFALNGFTSILFNWGLDHWLLREGGRAPGRIGAVYGSVFLPKMGFGVLWLAATAGLATLINAPQFPAELLAWSAASVLLDGIFASVLTAFKASLRNTMTSLLEAGSDTAWMLATVALAAAGSGEVIVFVQARVAVLFIAVIVGLATVKRFWRVEFSTSSARQALRNSRAFAASDLLAWVSMRFDVVIISLALGEQAVGLYSPAVGIVNAAFLIPAAVYFVILPVLSRQRENDRQQAAATERSSMQLQAAIGLALSAAVFLAAPIVVFLLRESYAETVTILRLLSPLLFFKCLSFGMAAILVAAGRQKQRALVQSMVVPASILLNLLVVIPFGIQGVAVVYVIAEILTSVGYWLLMRGRER